MIKASGLVASVCGFALLLAGCATTPPLSETSAVEYRKLADCVYLKLSPEVGPGLSKADAPTQRTSRLSLESSGVRYWELVITGVGPNQSSVAFTPSRNMWGSDAGSAAAVPAAVRSCS